MKSQNLTVAIALAVAATIAFAAFGSASLAHYASAQSSGNATSTSSNQTSTSSNSTSSAAPTITITSPVNGSTLSKRSFSVDGTANGTDLVNVTVSVDGGAPFLAKGTSNWTFAASVVADGNHKIVATVEDAAGMKANDTTSVTVKTPANTTTTTTSNKTSGTTISSTPQSTGSSVVQQGTVASNSTGFATILAPRSDAVYTGTISYTAGSSVELYVLHAYGISSNQNVSSQFSAPMTIKGPDGQTYAVSVITNAGSSSGQSGSTVFSGNGIMIHSAAGSFIAVYTLKASIDTPTIVNDFTSALVNTQTSSVNQTTTNQTSSNQTSTSSNNQTSSSSNSTSSSNATITVTAGSTNSTITVAGMGFTPSAQVTTTINDDSSTATTTQTGSDGSFDSSLLIDPAAVAGTTLHIKTTESSTGISATADYAVPK